MSLALGGAEIHALQAPGRYWDCWSGTTPWVGKWRRLFFSFLQQCLVLPSGLTQSPFAQRCLLPHVGPLPSATPPASHVLSPSFHQNLVSEENQHVSAFYKDHDSSLALAMQFCSLLLFSPHIPFWLGYQHVSWGFNESIAGMHERQIFRQWGQGKRVNTLTEPLRSHPIARFDDIVSVSHSCFVCWHLIFLTVAKLWP